MAPVTSSGAIQKRLDCSTTSLTYVWFTNFFPCIGVDKAKAVLKNRAVSGNFQSQLCVQYASVRTDMPDAPSAVGSPLVGAGESCTGVVDIATDTASKLYMRVGVAHSLSSGSSLGGADVTLDLSYVACGRIVSTVSREYLAYSTTSVSQAISGWLPALEVEEIKVGVVVSGLTGNAQWRICWRIATTSTEAPGAWTTTESFRNTNNTEVNTGEITISAASDMYIQIGAEVSLSSGSTPAQVTLVTALAVRRA